MNKETSRERVLLNLLYMDMDLHNIIDLLDKKCYVSAGVVIGARVEITRKLFTQFHKNKTDKLFFEKCIKDINKTMKQKDPTKVEYTG